MNDDPHIPAPPPSDEQGLTALLLGELDPDEAAAWERRLAHDEALQALRLRLQKTVDLLREAVPNPMSPSTQDSEHTCLTDERRQHLLQHFQQAAGPFRSQGSWDYATLHWVLPAALVAGLIFYLGFMLLMPMNKYAYRMASNPGPAAGSDNSQNLYYEYEPPPPPVEQPLQRFRGGSSRALYDADIEPLSRKPQPPVALGRSMEGDQSGQSLRPTESRGRVSGARAETRFFPAISSKDEISGALARQELEAKKSESGDKFSNLGTLQDRTAQTVETSDFEGRAGGYGGALLGGGIKQKLGDDLEPNSGPLPPPPPAPPSAPPNTWSMPGLSLTVTEPTVPTESFAIAPGERSRRISNESLVAENRETKQQLNQPLRPSDPQSRTSVAWEVNSPVPQQGEVKLNERARPDLLITSLEEIKAEDLPSLGLNVDANENVKSDSVSDSKPKASAESEKAISGRAGVELLAEKEVAQSSLAKRLAPLPTKPLPEILTESNPFSTFSLNVSDVSFKLAAASLSNGERPAPSSIRSEEFVNAMDYHDPAPGVGEKLAFAWEQARHPFEHQRDLVRFSIQTAAWGREPGRPLNLVVLLDNSGSMERADRVEIVRQALIVLAGQLTAADRISVVAFARTAHLWIDGLAGGNPDQLIEQVDRLNPQGGTNLELALELAYATAHKHFLASGNNRVILLTDGAANLGNVDPLALEQKVEAWRRRSIALDCFGVGWEGYNDHLLETLARHGDGRYGFLNNAVEAAADFAGQLAGALHVAAADVKAQVEFNPQRVISYRQIGYEKHQLTKEQFRDNTVDAAEIGAAESGTALYSIQVNPRGAGPLGVVRVRYKVPATGAHEEQEWLLPYQPSVPSLDQAYPSMRLAVVAGVFAEWLAENPYAANVTLPALQAYLDGAPEAFPSDVQPRNLQTMLRQARNLTGQ